MEQAVIDIFQKYPPNTAQFQPENYEELLSRITNELESVTETSAPFGKLVPYMTILIRSNRYSIRSMALRVLSLSFARDYADSRTKFVDQIVNIYYQLAM
jgi:hypothetical protein